LRVFLALAAVLSLSVARGEVKELLANGGFELTGAKGGPESWGIRNWGETEHAVTKVAGKARFGKQCLQLQGTSSPILYGVFSQPVDLGAAPPPELLLSLYYHTSGSPAPDLTVLTFGEDFSVAEWKTPALAADAIALEPASGWRALTWHVRVLPPTRQAIVMIRIHGAGSLFVDGVSLKEYPAEVACEVQAAGLVTHTNGARECRLRLTNRTAGDLPVRAQLRAEAPKGKAREVGVNAVLSPGKAETVVLGYPWPPDQPAVATLRITDPKGETIYEERTLPLPGLLDGRIITPAFRATILSHATPEAISAAGSVNATPELRRQLTLQARVGGLGLELGAVPVDEEGRWQISTPMTGMLTGNYSLELKAVSGSATVAELKMPLLKPAPKPAEACYDERMRLWVGDQMRLPLGVFYAVDEADLKAVAEAGFNMVVLPSRLAGGAMMDTADKLGLAVIVSSPNTEQEFWTGLYGRMAGRTNLAGWYLLHRPEAIAPPTSAAALAVMYAGLAQLDPRHPVCLAVGAPSRLADYAPACDILMPWTEPEPVGDVRGVDSLIGRALEVCAGQKPVWPIIQMTGAAYASDVRLDPQGNGRPPTPAEYRCMAYLALARGANGVFSFAYRVPPARNQREYHLPKDAPQLWPMVGKVNHELQALAPVLLEGEPVAVPADSADVAVRGYRYQDAFYVLAANPLGHPVTFGFRVPGMTTSQLEVAFDTRQVCGAAPGQFADQIEPFGVRVYMGR
jgi:hypothetical protein